LLGLKLLQLVLVQTLAHAKVLVQLHVRLHHVKLRVQHQLVLWQLHVLAVLQLVVTLAVAKNVPGGKSLKTNVVVTNATAIAKETALLKDATGGNSGKTDA